MSENLGTTASADDEPKPTDVKLMRRYVDPDVGCTVKQKFTCITSYGGL